MNDDSRLILEQLLEDFERQADIEHVIIKRDYYIEKFKQKCERDKITLTDEEFERFLHELNRRLGVS